MADNEIKLIDIVKILLNSGHQIEYTKRTDGSLRITSIDGQKYKGSKGNARAREMAGVSLSQARVKQLAKIKTKKGSKRKKKPPLPKDIQKKVERVQRIWKKNRVEREGYVGKRGARYNIEKFGEEEAMRVLNEQERYAQGLAYTEAVEWCIKRLESDLPNASKEDRPIIKNLIKELKDKTAVIKFADIYPFQLTIYDYEQGKITASDMFNQIVDVLKIRARGK